MLETPVLLLENFDEDSQMLYQSFRTSGFDGPVFTFSDEGFLPDDVTSIYTYYCGKKEGGSGNGRVGRGKEKRYGLGGERGRDSRVD